MPTHHSQGGAAGHDEHVHRGRHAGHSVRMFREKLWLSFALTIPVVAWSEHIEGLLGYEAPDFPGSDWLPPILGTAVFLYGGIVFLRSAWGELRDRRPGMMTLISLAITVAFVFSWIVQVGLLEAEALWWELATLVTIMILGHWIEMRSISQAQGALKELAKLLPDTARRLTGDGEEEVPVGQLNAGDVIVIRPGESVPADGKIRKGETELDESALTGESRPVRRGEGDEVMAGTINGQGSIRVEVTGTGNHTKLSGIMRLVSEAQQSKSRAQHLADRAARLLTLVAIGAGAVTLVAWLAVGADPGFSVSRTVTVLVIACPHALGLAVPLVVAISTTLGAQGGLLVRDRRGLEEARNLDTVVFDKTGTLTLGEFRVVELKAAEGESENDLLGVAASIEGDSEHPIARGIVRTAEERGLELQEPDRFQAIKGKGVSATVGGMKYLLGGPALLESERVRVPPDLEKAASVAADRGQAAIYLIRDGVAVCTFAVADAIRPESHDAVRRLQNRGIQVALLTGDSKAVADAVAEELGIDTVFAQVLPEDKASRIKELQRQGRRVAMVGDGVNDAPALATADVGIAIGAGTDVAVEAGDIVLVRSDPRDIPRIISLSRATYRKMVQNLWWAAGYNIVAIPLAGGVLAPWGILLSPALGAVLMSASTVIVAINAQLLRRAELYPLDYSSYLRVLLSVWVGLGLGQLVQALHRLVRFKGPVKWDWIPVVWAGFSFLMVVQTWWAYFELLESPLWVNLFAFLLPLTVFVILYLLCASALPDLSKNSEGDRVDLSEFYRSQRPYFFLLWGALLVLAVVVSRLSRGSFAPVEDGFRLGGVVVALTLALTEKRSVHAVLTVTALIALSTYIILFSLQLSPPN